MSKSITAHASSPSLPTLPVQVHNAVLASAGNCYCPDCTSNYLEAKRKLDAKLRNGEITIERAA